MAIVLINVSLGIIQEIKSKRATDRLKLITAATAQVIRSGKKKSVPTAEVVLDDVILFETGKQVCSDSVVLSGEVEVNESLLTGESEPVIKKPACRCFRAAISWAARALPRRQSGLGQLRRKTFVVRAPVQKTEKRNARVGYPASSKP